MISIDLNRAGNLAAFVSAKVIVTFLKHTSVQDTLLLKTPMTLHGLREKSRIPLPYNQYFGFLANDYISNSLLYGFPLTHSVVFQITHDVTLCLWTECSFPHCLFHSSSPSNCYFPNYTLWQPYSTLYSFLQGKSDYFFPLVSTVPFTGLWYNT